jgi:hypothetical protein
MTTPVKNAAAALVILLIMMSGPFNAPAQNFPPLGFEILDSAATKG